MYQHIVLHDFLKRIVDHRIVEDLITNGNMIHDPYADNVFMPLEFSVAAYRFGHSMVRAEIEQIRRREDSRMLKKVDLSPEVEEAIDGFSRALVAELLLGRVCEVMRRLGPLRAQRVRFEERSRQSDRLMYTFAEAIQGSAAHSVLRFRACKPIFDREEQ